MNPSFRRVWLVSIVFSTLIDLVSTYILLKYCNDYVAGITSHELSPFIIAHNLLARFGAEVTLFVIIPLFTAVLVAAMLHCVSKYWPRGNSGWASFQKMCAYLIFLVLAGFKFYVAAQNTHLILEYF